MRPSRRRFRQFIVAALVALAAGIGLFMLNGLVLADRTAPRMQQIPVEPAPTASALGEVTILAYNIAKAFVHKGGITFDSRENVEGRLHRMAAIIRAEKPDFVFLSEAITECGPCDVNQAEHLAREAGLPHVATGENYNVGLPFFRIVGGNAVLSRTPLTPVANFDLAGRRPFYITRNNRRALVVSAEIGGRTVLGSVLKQ